MPNQPCSVYLMTTHWSGGQTKSCENMDKMEPSSDKFTQSVWHCCDALYLANKPSLQDITRFYHALTERFISRRLLSGTGRF